MLTLLKINRINNLLHCNIVGLSCYLVKIWSFIKNSFFLKFLLNSLMYVETQFVKTGSDFNWIWIVQDLSTFKKFVSKRLKQSYQEEAFQEGKFFSG